VEVLSGAARPVVCGGLAGNWPAAIEHRVDPDFDSTRTYPRSFGASAIAGGVGGVDVEIRL
jgi:hypothetical protein